MRDTTIAYNCGIIVSILNTIVHRRSENMTAWQRNLLPLILKFSIFCSCYTFELNYRAALPLRRCLSQNTSRYWNFKMKFVGYRDWNQKLVKDYCRLCTYSILHNGCVFTMYCDFAAVTYFRYFNKNSDASNNRLRSLRIKFRCCQSGT